MADTKISALTAASAALGADELAINEAGTSKKLTVTQLQTFLAIPALGVATPIVESGSGAAGSAVAGSHEDHVHPGAFATATPALTLGTANAQGVATTSLQTDATILAFDATAPSTQAFGDTAVVGTATVTAHRDHKHAMPASPLPATNSTIWGPHSAAGPVDGSMMQTDLAYAEFQIPVACTITGVVFKNGSISNGNVKVAMYNAAGTRVGVSGAVAQGSAWEGQAVAFTAPYAAAAGLYYLAFATDSATAKFMVGTMVAHADHAGSDSYTTIPATITPPGALLGWSLAFPGLTTY